MLSEAASRLPSPKLTGVEGLKLLVYEALSY